MSIEQMFNKRAVTQRPTFASDAFGTSTMTLATVYAALPCRISSGATSHTRLYARERMEEHDTLYWPGTHSDVQHQDRVSVDGETWEVWQVHNPSQIGRHYEADLRKLTGSV